jgi:uncharacterized protein (TIGR02270 family)
MKTDILEQHFEEFEFLWGLRQKAVISPDYALGDLTRLDARIEAHVKALAYGGNQWFPILVGKLEDDDPVVVFAAAYTLLRTGGKDTTRQVMDAFSQAEASQRDGIRIALSQVPITALLSQLRQMLSSSEPPIGIAAAEVLACHGQLEITSDQFNKFLKNDAPAVRQAAWRTAARTTIPRKPEAYEAGLRDEDVGARRQAMQAAAWGKHQPLLDFCRKKAVQPGPERWETVQLLAILGKPTELPRLLALAKGAEANARCFHALGTFGHPGSMDTILTGMKNQNPRIAVAAAAAFAKITGRNVESDQRVPLPPEDGSTPDDFEKEFLDEAKLPSLKLAGDHWQKVSADFAKGTRWCRGLDVSKPAPPEVLARLDMESRLETFMRMRFEGTWQGSLATLEKFPQKMG